MNLPFFGKFFSGGTLGIDIGTASIKAVEISIPTVLIWGEKDGITPLAHAYFMKEKIPGAKLEIIPNVKHNPHREAPETLVEKIKEFIQ